MKVISNTNWFENKVVNGCDMEFYNYNAAGRFGLIKAVMRSFGSDCVFINIGAKHLYYFCIVKMMFPFADYTLISFDIVLSKPVSFKEKIACKVKSFLLNKVDYFILFIKEVSPYEKYYGVRQEKFFYMPFKVNSYRDILKTKTKDDGYILTGGVSKRDYKTFFNAMRGLDYKAIVLVPPNEVSIAGGTLVERSNVPDNVEIVHDNGSSESWIDYFSKAKFVVLPIKESTISPTGISTYLLAMALKKCVVISVCPATKDILNDKTAVLVPPNDEEALRKAIVKVYEDSEYSKRVAEEGYKYAVSLKGHDRMVEDILAFISKTKGSR